MIVRTSTFSRFLFASLLASSAVVACSGDEDDDTDTDTGVDHDGMDHDGTSDGMDNDGMDNDGSGGEDTTPDVTPDGSGGVYTVVICSLGRVADANSGGTESSAS